MFSAWRPGPAARWHLSALCVSGLAAVFWPAGKLVLLGHGGLLLFLMLADGLALRFVPAIAVDRQVPDSLALGVWTEVLLRLQPERPLSLRLEVFDHAPPAAEVEGMPVLAQLQRGQGVEISYRLRALRRGDHPFGRVELLAISPLGIWRRRRWAGEAKPVRVLPNFEPVARYALLALADRLGQMGIRFQRRRGEGLEFRELREYRQGDSLRQIDWKATARWQKAISRQYEEERNQQIVLLLDCGRRLRAQDDDLSHFDHCLNAALLLAWVALRQGDLVGLATMGGIDRHLLAQKGRGGLAALVGAVYDLEPTLEPADYQAAAAALLARQRRRALVVVLTNLRDEDVDELQPALKLLCARHLVLLASLKEQSLREVLHTEPQSLDQALEIATTHGYLANRRQAHEKIKGQGAQILDVEPDRLAIEVVNRYLEIKRGGQL
jgi:uncharacterized protein (DUF58 family)